MLVLDLMELRPRISPASEEAVLQSCVDLRSQAEVKLEAMVLLQHRLADVREADDEPLVRLVCAQELVQLLSKARSEWCRAATSVERSELELDAIYALRRTYTTEIDDALRR
jgi:hypothetical protein